MAVVNKYKLYNLSTGLNEYGWSESAPTVPFSNSSQTLDPASVRIIDTIQRSVVAIREDYKATGGFYEVEGYSLSVPASSAASISYSQPYPTVACDITFASDVGMQGDVLNIYSNDTAVGLLTVAASIGDTTITVSSTVIQNVVRGFYVTLSDGVNTDPLFRVLDVNTTTDVLTLDRALSFNFGTSTGVLMRVYFAKNYLIGPPMKHTLGTNIAGNVSMPANQVSTAVYTNNSATPKTIYFNLQRLY